MSTINNKKRYNAKLEFEYIWDEKKLTGMRSVDITNDLSEKMNDLCDIISV